MPLHSYLQRIAITITCALVMCVSAPAAVIYSGVQNIPIATTFEGVYLDIDTGTTSASTITGWDINPFFGGYAVGNSADFQPARTGTGVSDGIIALASGDVVDGTLAYATGEAGSSTHIGTGAEQFGAGSEGYLAFRFFTNNSDGPYYGWMRVTFTVNTPGGIIHDWAYDNTGAAILAGSLLGIPEPGRVVLLLIGIPLMALRRRRGRGCLTLHTPRS